MGTLFPAPFSLRPFLVRQKSRAVLVGHFQLRQGRRTVLFAGIQLHGIARTVLVALVDLGRVGRTVLFDDPIVMQFALFYAS